MGDRYYNVDERDPLYTKYKSVKNLEDVKSGFLKNVDFDCYYSQIMYNRTAISELANTIIDIASTMKKGQITKRTKLRKLNDSIGNGAVLELNKLLKKHKLKYNSQTITRIDRVKPKKHKVKEATIMNDIVYKLQGKIISVPPDN